jgi:hypothetical protein
MKLCYKSSDGKLICPPILLQLPDWLRHIGPTPPEPPDPWPWREIYTIAVIDELTKTLSPERAKPIQAALRSAIHPDRDLPKGASVSF